MHVECAGSVHADRVSGFDQVQVLERAQRAQVEDAVQVDVEALGPLAGEDLSAARQRVDGCVSEGGRVVRRAADSHVDRRARQPGR